MRTVIFLIIFSLLPVSGFARKGDIGFGRDDCPEMQATELAIKVRQSRTEAVYNTLIDDPEDDRGILGGCIESINVLGDAYSMGVKLPGMDQIIASLCAALNPKIREKLRKIEGLVDNPDFGFIDPFNVNADPDQIADELLRELKTDI